jgi:glycosyltransferase involved in cell wall biosynthesis
MSNSIYVTFDNVDINNGAGLVCYHEIRALRKVSNLLKVISQPDIKHFIEIYGYNPFLNDYFSAGEIPTGVGVEYPGYIDLLHLSCSPGLAILNRVHPKHYVVNVVAHDLQTSISEHELYYGKGSYPFIHNTDYILHSKLLQHAFNADMILCPSSSAKKWIEDNIRRDRITVIHHGCEIPNTILPIPNHFTIGYLGAFGPDKGLPYLGNAYRSLNNPTEITMLWGGNCSEVMLKMFPETKATGWLDNVADFYNQISVYVQPSVTEGFGIEILEAMAYGRPVIATTGTAGPDVIDDGINGFIIPPKDIQAIWQKLMFFKENPGICIEMGMRAREKAKQFTWDIVEKKYEKMYSEVLNVK